MLLKGEIAMAFEIALQDMRMNEVVKGKKSQKRNVEIALKAVVMTDSPHQALKKAKTVDELLDS